MKAIVVKTQAEWDALPKAFDEFTIIEIRSEETITILNSPNNSSAELRDNSKAELRDNSKAELRDNSKAELRDNSKAELRDNSKAELRDNSKAVLRENSKAVLMDISSAVLRENSSAVLWDNSSAVLWENSKAVLRVNSSAELRDNSKAVLRDNSSAVLRVNSSAVLRENSSAVLWENSSAVFRDNSSAVLWDISSAELRENSSAVLCSHSSAKAYMFSNIVVYSCNAIVESLCDMAVCRLRGVEITPKQMDDTATLLREPEKLDITFETWLSRGYVVADGIYSKLISKKKQRDIEIFTVQKDFLDDKKSYVVKRGNVFSHGDTIKKAIEDLRYKLADRDTSRFSKWKLSKEISLDDAIQSYRAITGACEFGVKDFVNKTKIPNKLTVNKVIELTKDAYGNRKYAEFFGSKEK